MQLAAEAAPAPAQRLAKPPPFPPAAQRCARTLVPSTPAELPLRLHALALLHHRTGLSLAASSRMLTAVPESAYRRYRPRVKALRLPRAFPSRALVFVTLADVPNLPSVEAISLRFQHHARSVELTGRGR